MKNYCVILLYLSVSLLPVIVLAQTPVQVRTIVVASKDSTLTFQVLYNSNKVIANEGLFYYWERYDQIHSNQGGFTGNLLHGKYNVTNQKGQLIKEGQFCNGTRHAEWKEWNEQGDLICKSIWYNGTLKEKYQKQEDGRWEQITFKIKDIPFKKTITNGDKKLHYKYVKSQWVEKKNFFTKLGLKRK